MKSNEFSRLTEKAISIKLKAVDRLIEEFIEPLEKVGSPEELIGKPYETWNGQDLMILTQIYGNKDDTPLANLVFKKEYAKVKALEQEEQG